MSLLKVIVFFVLGYWLVKSLARYFGGEIEDPKDSNSRQDTGKPDSSRTSAMDIQDAEYEDVE